ncbi:site-specific integrase [Permianibacter sp. IMCC34836]|uniref:site-specific integrase n=1 Tax=Permianibacter fluminis TaxID=2738515 RepID=UPI0015536DBE|nr:site-specific integrase [Permianibacter fluminis]NQD38254.1 site-specific integrase [Permianibacter fluminis]
MRNLMQHYVIHRLTISAPRTGVMAGRFLLQFQDEIAQWPTAAEANFIELAIRTTKTQHIFLRNFYRFALRQQAPGFIRPMLRVLETIKHLPPLQLVDSRARHRSLNPAEERKLIDSFNTTPSLESNSLRNECLLQICWELGLRPTQIRGLEERHLIFTQTPAGSYFAVDALRAKQRHVNRAYKRRAISNELGEKLLLLIVQNRLLYGSGGSELPLFRTRLNAAGRRLPSKNFAKRMAHDTLAVAIATTLCQRVGKGRTANTLRHHMAQKLADLGAPAEVIAELLDHSSLSSVLVYVRARSDIASIKTRALGLNPEYGELLGWLSGRSPIPRTSTAPAAEVIQGVVANRYIGNIGLCALPAPNRCPKNPVYACYGCQDFTPFVDGDHAAVATAMAAEHLQLLAGSGNTVNPIAVQNEHPIAVARAVQTLCDTLRKAAR